jgi:hypothetical protein
VTRKKRTAWHLPHLEHDGLFTPEVHDYAEDRYRLVRHYVYMFTAPAWMVLGA